MKRGFDLPEPVALPAQRGQTFVKLVELTQRLLAEDGCPWDREQTPHRMRRYVLEEACEVIDAIEDGNPSELKEELGDLALQVVFLAELARKEAGFGPDDVVLSICEKLVRRHPHVFEDQTVEDSTEVLRNWEAIKAEEKAGRRVLDGVPRSLPALARAQRMSDKVSRVGFDWPTKQGSRDKVAEEVAELNEALAGGDRERVEHELGDLLFALVNLARHEQLDAEIALRKASERFRERFAHVEDRVRAVHGGFPRAKDGKPAPGIALSELDGYWNEAKGREK
ncbi:MAG TPA: nucleoside triphosphate pyrophosphohydrolase [Polyangiaceae bacterium]|nr:nucleoside triphosphate pyrophosphohydrolase [Polyangiaceae bacterium]